MPKLDKGIFLIAALRTPIGKFGGALASMTAPQLGVASAKATIECSAIDPAGLATLCVSGGMGLSMIVERV